MNYTFDNITLCIIAIIYICTLCAIISFIFSNLRTRSCDVKELEMRYGKPIKQFKTALAWNTLVIKHSSALVNLYSDFIVIKFGKKEILLKNTSPNIKFYTSLLYCVLEIQEGDKNTQITLTHKEYKMLKEFFNK